VKAILETARLRLREMQPGDLDFVAAMLADKEVTRYYERTFTRADAQVSARGSSFAMAFALAFPTAHPSALGRWSSFGRSRRQGPDRTLGSASTPRQ
jgi:RimJ/RimL family protein N-acetyltransferase